MKQKIEAGRVYTHILDGSGWIVRVTKILPLEKNLSQEWVGILVGDQFYCKDGDAVWGYIRELREQPRNSLDISIDSVV